jgi:asparagine synthase (glutamine-hydrolysing)
LFFNWHSFYSLSDTELFMVAFRVLGADCLSHLNGMFAFALYDARRQSVFLARDRAGEKPLFYQIANGTLRFASELKALLVDASIQRRINPEALDCYLAMGYVPGDRCILDGFHKLPPAHAMQFSLQSREAKIWRYWQLPEIDSDMAHGRVNESDLIDELEALLEDTVHRQLVADVPVGVLLSGGVDSSLVTAMAVRASAKVKTFTIRFPGFSQYDETEHARLIAQHFDTEHVELDAVEATVDIMPQLARQFDEPVVDSSMIPTYLVSQLISGHCKVALGGDGGDELFGGYGHYDRLLWMQQKRRSMPRGLRLPVAKAAEALLPVGFKGRNWLQGLEVDLNKGLPLISPYFDRTTRQNLMAGQANWTLLAEDVREQRTPNMADLLQRATRMDFENYLAEDILVKVDRASMLNSLEVRAPLLDFRLIEFAFGKVPSYLKATATSRKVLLKKLTARILPPQFDQHRKQGFSIPLASWLQSGSPWQAFFREVLLDSDSNLFSRQVVSKLLDGQSKGRANSERLFSLVLFELWCREYNISL